MTGFEDLVRKKSSELDHWHQNVLHDISYAVALLLPEKQCGTVVIHVSTAGSVSTQVLPALSSSTCSEATMELQPRQLASTSHEVPPLPHPTLL